MSDDLKLFSSHLYEKLVADGEGDSWLMLGVSLLMACKESCEDDEELHEDAYMFFGELELKFGSSIIVKFNG